MFYAILFSIGCALFSYNPLTFLKPGFSKPFCENCNAKVVHTRTCHIVEDTESLIPNNKLVCE